MASPTNLSRRSPGRYRSVSLLSLGLEATPILLEVAQIFRRQSHTGIGPRSVAASRSTGGLC